MDFLNEQNNGFVRLDGTQLRLPTLTAWRLSPSVYWFRLGYPCAAMSFKAGNADGAEYGEAVAMAFDPARELWRAYVPGRIFAAPCETYYKVVCWDEYGRRHVCGEGVFRVQGGALRDPDEEPLEADGCFVPFPDGKWRRVTVFTDAAGELSFLVEQRGFASDEFTDAPSQPFAYEKASGLYHALTGFVDASGEAYLAVSSGGVTGRSGAFARDEKTGLYHRVETVRDEAGEMASVVGEARK